jgi:ABC-2 type transport system permease protein
MRKFKILAKNGFKTAIAYRAHFFVGLIRVPITLLIYYYLWRSIFGYAGAEVIKGYTFADMLSYYAVSMIVGIIAYCDVDEWISGDIRAGLVVADFLRPVSYIWNLFSVFFGLRVFAFFVEALPALFIAVFFIHTSLPSLINSAMFIVSVALAYLLNYLMSFCLGLAAFWFNEVHGLIKAKNALMAFLEGSLIPLAFFPLFFQGISQFLPFQYLRFIPVNIFLQKYSLAEALALLGIQAVWLVLFYFIAQFTFKKAFKKFAGAGV